MNLSYADAVQILIGRHCIAADRQGAFKARLKHLQRLGFPAGVNTGKGRRAVYDWLQIIELNLAFELIGFGLPPELAVDIVSNSCAAIEAACIDSHPRSDLKNPDDAQATTVMIGRPMLAVLLSDVFHSLKVEAAIDRSRRLTFASVDTLKWGLTATTIVPDTPTMVFNFSHLLGFQIASIASVRGITIQTVIADFDDWVNALRLGNG